MEQPTPWDNDTVQFARFMEEAQAAGAFSEAEVIEGMAESMDLTVEDVQAIAERARLTWAISRLLIRRDIRAVRCVVVTDDPDEQFHFYMIVCHVDDVESGDICAIILGTAHADGLDQATMLHEEDLDFKRIVFDWGSIPLSRYVIAPDLRALVGLG